MLTRVDIPEETAERFVVDKRFIVLRVLPQGQLPEAQSDLVAALANLNRDDLSGHPFTLSVDYNNKQNVD